MKVSKFWTYVIGILCVIGGILLILNPYQSMSSLVFYVGLTMLITGIIRIVASIFIKSYFIPGSGFLSGVWNILFGIILMSDSEDALEVISLFLGLWFLVSAISNIISIIRYRKIYVDYLFLAKAILKLILGILVFVTPIVPAVLTGTVLGIVLIVIGVITIVTYKDDENIYKVKVK